MMQSISENQGHCRLKRKRRARYLSYANCYARSKGFSNSWIFFARSPFSPCRCRLEQRCLMIFSAWKRFFSKSFSLYQCLVLMRSTFYMRFRRTGYYYAPLRLFKRTSERVVCTFRQMLLEVMGEEVMRASLDID